MVSRGLRKLKNVFRSLPYEKSFLGGCHKWHAFYIWVQQVLQILCSWLPSCHNDVNKNTWGATVALVSRTICLRICGTPPLWTFLKETLRHIFLAWLLLKVPHHLFYSSIVASFFICYFTLFAFGHLCLFVFVFVALSFSHVQHIGLQPLHEMCYINKIDLMIWFDLIYYGMGSFLCGKSNWYYLVVTNSPHWKNSRRPPPRVPTQSSFSSGEALNEIRAPVSQPVLDKAPCHSQNWD